MVRGLESPGDRCEFLRELRCNEVGRAPVEVLICSPKNYINIDLQLSPILAIRTNSVEHGVSKNNVLIVILGETLNKEHFL